MVNPINPVGPHESATVRTHGGFSETLAAHLTFSRHAQERIQQRNLPLDAEEMRQLAEATARAGKSGAKQAAIVMERGIFIVSPPTGTVITSMERTSEPMQLISQVDAMVLVSRTQKEASSSRPTDGGPSPAHWSLARPAD